MTTKAIDQWKDVAKPTDDELELLWHTNLCSVLYSDDSLPISRSEQHYARHLQYVRFLVSLPSEGVELTISRERGSSTLTAYCQAAILNGWLEEAYDPKNGRRIISPSEKLDSLLVLTGRAA